ncbi:NAD-dependent epimerase/dehydratase family protein [Pararcticibacter amylolyticus]|uniref:Nucleoside-diphosphate sugar epimerase n=1 Tax=Pararcticibacter amylolyticus TaxID=2173175 RepID=A0A2U2PBS4_9SPHI|nr:NAD-dependent epimerase/dehydratase family protein [Pararcticibacter amylolyticus]PWG78803.1 nucleoside-diphosphate sugar epimerase [Pararcticibacter amylolyticus]
MKQKTIVVTGGSGFVGSNLIKKLNQRGVTNIIIIDNYDEQKFWNIKNCSFVDYISYKNELKEIEQQLDKYEIEAILHIGANADVLIKDANLMMASNYEHSKFYLNFCIRRNIPLLYASSSAVYGNSYNCVVGDNFEHPHNVYSWSKWMFDKLVLNNIDTFTNRVIGLRFFNIFGHGESHKGKNASLPHRFFSFIQNNGYIDLFNKEIQRDYVWVEDVANVILDILYNSSLPNGIYNLGSGNPISHKSLAEIVSNSFIERGLKNSGDRLVRLIPMPDDLTDSFQFFTRAENLHEIVQRYTSNNEEKVKLYINELIDLHEEKDETNLISSSL